MAAGGTGMVAIWESLEMSQIIMRGRAVYDNLFLALALFLLGTLLGLLHGSVLAYVGRSDFCSTRRTRQQLLRAFVASVPLGLVALVVASWLSLTSVALQSGPRLLWALALLGWLASAGMWGYAAYESTGACRIAFARWAGGAIGLAVAGLAFVLVFLLSLVYTSGEGPPLEVDLVAAWFVSFLATVWIVIPFLTILSLAIVGSRFRRQHLG